MKSSVPAAVWALALTLAGVAGAAGEPARPPHPVWDAREPFLALIVGMVDASWEGRMSGREVHAYIEGTGRPSRLPLDDLAAISRREREGRRPAQWTVAFNQAQILPVPYSILGYNPGHVSIGPSFVLEEWSLGNFVFSYDDDGRSRRMVLEDVTLWALGPGTLFMDIDGWLDTLMGSRLDDTHIAGFALFTHRGQRYVAALGYNTEGSGTSGVFHLNRDRIMYPYPGNFQKASALLRARLERLAPGAVLPFRRVGR